MWKYFIPLKYCCLLFLCKFCFGYLSGLLYGPVKQNCWGMLALGSRMEESDIYNIIMSTWYSPYPYLLLTYHIVIVTMKNLLVLRGSFKASGNKVFQKVFLLWMNPGCLPHSVSWRLSFVLFLSVWNLVVQLDRIALDSFGNVSCFARLLCHGIELPREAVSPPCLQSLYSAGFEWHSEPLPITLGTRLPSDLRSTHPACWQVPNSSVPLKYSISVGWRPLGLRLTLLLSIL